MIELAKRAGLVVAGLVLAAGAAVAAIWFISTSQIDKRVGVPTDPIQVPTDISAVQYGDHLAGAIALCGVCHGTDMSGRVIRDDAVARVVAPNLTRGGVGANLSDAELARAIRDGVDPSGRQLWVMPSDAYHDLSDNDLADIIAYLRALPPVTSKLPSSSLHPLGRFEFVTGQMDLLPSVRIDQGAPRGVAPDPGVTPAYGQYLVELSGCARCHGPTLAGGSLPNSPHDAAQAEDLTPAGLVGWSEADFVRAMRTGRRPDGSALDPLMPWQYFAQMSDLELAAIWTFLQLQPH
jgi:cytochrome c553